jgi:isoquinoline 1-oxidoreductase subunit alpha
MKLTVNGTERTLDMPGDTPLVWALRDGLGLTGTKPSCAAGVCGACTVHLDGVAARSCQVTLAQLAGRRVITIEALPADHRVVRAWIAEDVVQCGYCQPGFVMAAAALLARTPQPTNAQIDEALTNVCRCGTYPRVRAAVQRAAADKA